MVLTTHFLDAPIYWLPAGNKITAPLAKEIQPETFEPGGAVPAEAVHVTSTAGATALIVCTVDVAGCVVPPNVRLQFDVVLASAVPVSYKVNVQVSGSPEQEVRSAETWAEAALPVPTKG